MHPELRQAAQAPETVKLLPLDYDPEVPVDVLQAMEAQAKAAGLPLDQIELLGQDEQVCRDFTHIARHAGIEAALLTTDWLLLEASWQVRKQG